MFTEVFHVVKIIEEAEFYKPGWKDSIFQDATQLYQQQVQMALKLEKEGDQKIQKEKKVIKEVSDEEKRRQIEEELIREEEEEKKKQSKRK